MQFSVKLLLSGGKVAIGNLLDFVRQVFRNFLFQPAQQYWSQSLRKARSLRLRSSPDRQFVTLAKICSASEVAGKNKFNNRPEITNRILDGSTRQDKPVPASQRHGSLRVLSVGIFDVSRFIKKNRSKLEAAVFVEVATQQWIACQHKITGWNFCEQFASGCSLHA